MTKAVEGTAPVVLELRGFQVMIDADVAASFGTTTGRLNQQERAG